MQHLNPVNETAAMRIPFVFQFSTKIALIIVLAKVVTMEQIVAYMNLFVRPIAHPMHFVESMILI
jgi:hypothetical protein